jgi:hypothetical protein
MRVNAARERRVTEGGGRRDELGNRRGNTARNINKKLTKGKEKAVGSLESSRGSGQKSPSFCAGAGSISKHFQKRRCVLPVTADRRAGPLECPRVLRLIAAAVGRPPQSPRRFDGPMQHFHAGG